MYNMTLCFEIKFANAYWCHTDDSAPSKPARALAIYTVHTAALALEYFVLAIVFHQNLLQWFSLYYAAQSTQEKENSDFKLGQMEPA